MLRLLRKSLPNLKKRHLFLYKTICLSAGMHVLLALMIIIMIQFSSTHTFVVRKEHMNKEARIVLVPFARRITPSATYSLPQQTPKEVTTAQGRKPNKIAPMKKVTQAKTSTTTLKKEPNPAVKKQPEKKKIEEKKSLKSVPKKTIVESKKNFDTKPIKKVEKKTVQKEAQKSLSSEEKTNQKVEAQKQPMQKEVSPGPIQQDATAEEHVLYLGRDEFQELQLFKTVSSALEKEWQPPVGLPSTCFCQISFLVNNDGVATDIQIMESSKILAYDIAARSAVSRAHFENYARGKKCSVVFKV